LNIIGRQRSIPSKGGKTMTVVLLPVVTTLDIPVARIIDGARDADLDDILVLGTTKDGLNYFASSQADGAQALWLIEHAKMRLLQAGGVLE
jgi:hypothetical protein